MKKMAYLKEFSFARSGDKGDVANIGLLAKSDECYKIIREEVTPEKVKAFFKDMVKGNVSIWPMDNINALMVVLNQGIGGGATRTLRYDQTAKSIGQALLRMQIEAEEDAIERAKEAERRIFEKYA
jgi:hypothetical protein